MPKTLADMTPEQREQCIGMWFDTIFGLGILEALQEEPKEGDPLGRFSHPDRGSWHTETFKGLTPRHDLPRAWNPDGTPPKGEWEHPEGEFEDRGGGYSEYVHEPIRRWVGEWEATE